jgi:hypothetical protein
MLAAHAEDAIRLPILQKRFRLSSVYATWEMAQSAFNLIVANAVACTAKRATLNVTNNMAGAISFLPYYDNIYTFYLMEKCDVLYF